MLDYKIKLPVSYDVHKKKYVELNIEIFGGMEGYAVILFEDHPEWNIYSEVFSGKKSFKLRKGEDLENEDFTLLLPVMNLRGTTDKLAVNVTISGGAEAETFPFRKSDFERKMKGRVRIDFDLK